MLMNEFETLQALCSWVINKPFRYQYIIHVAQKGCSAKTIDLLGSSLSRI